MPRIELVSPVSLCTWPHLSEPDYNFKPDIGEYNVTLLINKTWKEGMAYVDEINSMVNEWQARCTSDAGGELGVFHSPVKTYKHDDTIWAIKFGMNAKGTEKATGRDWEQRPTLIDVSTQAKKKSPRPFEDAIGRGSHLQVAAQPYMWFSKSKGKMAGVKLQPRKVLVYRCVPPESEGSTLEIAGYTAEETSYVINGEKFDLSEDDKDDVANQEF